MSTSTLAEAYPPATAKPAASYTLPKRPWLQHPTSFEHILAHQYKGSGTPESPYLVSFIDNDPENPQTYGSVYKWFVLAIASVTTLAVALASSAYSGGIRSSIVDFGASQELMIAGVSLFVLGFAFGPLVWAPLSEMYGRRNLFIFTYSMFTLWTGICIASQTSAQLLVFRFLAGFFGSSPLTNAGGTVFDIFSAKQRGLGMAFFSASPFVGPALGPIIGGFIGEAKHGWRWIEVFLCALCGVLTILGTLFSPETYAPVILRSRAQRLSQATERSYVYIADAANPLKPKELIKAAITRPWAFLFLEPIVTAVSLYMAIVYGILYCLFPGIPYVFTGVRGWSSGLSGLAFLGVLVGMMSAVAYTILYENPRYVRVIKASATGRGVPEDRLPPAIIGAIVMPIGLGWYAGTNGPEIHWIVCILATIPFGFGMVLVFLSLMNYLVEVYTIYAASALAANSVLRSLFGAAFPLFTTQMYDALGIHWAASIPAFLALACVPIPILFYKKGAVIRAKGKRVPVLPSAPPAAASEKPATGEAQSAA